MNVLINKGASLDPRCLHALSAANVCCAPGFLSGFSEAEITLVRRRLKEHVAPGIAAARDATLKALKEAEVGWQKAIDKISARAGLTKGPDGTCSDASMSVAAE